jgi:peptidase YpeB-like protein
MRMTLPAITAALLFCASTLAVAQTSMTTDEAKKKIEAAGYTMVENVKPSADGYTAVAMKGGKMLPVKVDKDGKVEQTK